MTPLAQVREALERAKAILRDTGFPLAEQAIVEALSLLPSLTEGARGTPCGDCGEYRSTITIPMPHHWASAREHRSFVVDACIASEVLKLVYVHGVRTMNSCCGHARALPSGAPLPATVIVAEEHIGIMLGLGYERADYGDGDARRDIFVIPPDRVKHIGPLPPTDTEQEKTP